MARCVADLAILMQTIAGPDPQDPPSAAPLVADWLGGLSRSAPPRLGRFRGLFESRAEPVVNTMLDEASRRLRERGADVLDLTLPAAFAEVVERHRTVMAVEAAAYHEARLRRHPHDYDPCFTTLLREGLGCPAPEYARCKEHQRQLSLALEACLEGIDALLTPATTSPAPDTATTGDAAFNSPWSYTGLPTVSLPAQFSPEGLPLAIQLAGKRNGEAELMSVAAWCEQTLGFDPGDPRGV
jgi:Asp-tRNA(Asn)/Glu-tRNA(Gln) amidotransferase A subunit family amidase